MKTNVMLSCVTACALAVMVPMAAMSDTTSGAEAKVVIKDSAIESSIKAHLEADHNGGFGHVRVDADDHGIVKLEGHVRTQDAADRAISIAKNTDGVREVQSSLEVNKDD